MLLRTGDTIWDTFGSGTLLLYLLSSDELEELDELESSIYSRTAGFYLDSSTVFFWTGLSLEFKFFLISSAKILFPYAWTF